MRKFKEWMIDTRPDVLDRGKCLLEGQEVEFGTINSKRLVTAVHEHYREGQEALRDFVRWLVRHEGLNESTAQNAAATVWNVCCLTWNHDESRSYPEKILLSTTYKQSTLANFQTCLLRYARFSKNLDLIAKIQEIRGSQKKIVYERKAEATQYCPYTRSEIQALLEAAEVLRDDPRWPWGWPTFRMILKAGVSILELCVLTREQISHALSTESLVLWRPKRGPRSIPTEIVRSELEALLAWPWTWTTVADIISPQSSREWREQSANTAIRRVAHFVFDKAGVEWTKHWILSCRWASALRYFELTKNFVGVSHLSGLRDIKRVQSHLVTMMARQKEREKTMKPKRRRRSVVQEAEADGGGDEG